MELYRVTKGSPEWLYVAYDYIRIDSFCFGQGIPMQLEFRGDDSRDELRAVILVEDLKPIAGCRITFPAEGVGKIERVCVIREKQKGGYGRILMEEAEKWIFESGARHIVINSQDRAAEFYNKIGYVTNYEVSPRVYDTHHEEKEKDEAFEKWLIENKDTVEKAMNFSTVLVEKFI
jgi:predicted GNAT family N-acyltransferase